MTKKKSEHLFLTEPFGTRSKSRFATAATPPDKPYWLGIGQGEPCPWDFPLSMVLRPIWQPHIMCEDGPHKHSEGEVLYFIGGDPMNFDEFGAEVEVSIGEGDDVETYTITKTTFLYLPPYLPHCPIVFKRVDKPIMFGHIMFVSEYDRAD